MMDQSTTISKLFRALQFRKHVKELTSACKRINKDTCYEFVTYRHGTPDTLSTQKKSTKFNLLRSKINNHKQRSKSASRLSTRIRPKNECSSSATATATTTTATTTTSINVLNNAQPFECLAHATATSPANLSMIVKQSYKPLHAKSTQFNKNTIAVTKGTHVKALYAVSNWVFIEIIQTGQTGIVPVYCLRLLDSSAEASSQNNLSLLNVSIYDKQLHSTINTSTPPHSGRFISSIGPCHLNFEPLSLNYSRLSKTGTYTTRHNKDQSNLSRQISNMSLHAYDQDAYGTLNLTPCRSLSFSVLDSEPISYPSNNRLRVMENYQRKFVGDISVLESEVVTLVNTTQSNNDWRFIRRGDGRQGYIPRHIIMPDRNFN